MKFIKKIILTPLLILFLLFNGLCLWGAYYIYNQIKIEAVNFKAATSSRLERYMERQKSRLGGDDITIPSDDGYDLSATFLPNTNDTDDTVIIVHGLGQNKVTSMSYANIYLRYGYNVLLIDSRAHGNSGGGSVTWGVKETADLDEWVHWLHQKYPNGKIGAHGISLGAATVLLHSKLNEKDELVAFYVSDSAYSNFEDLIRIKVDELIPHTYSDNVHKAANIATYVLFPYMDLMSYVEDHFTFYEASPITAVKESSVPILYLHGESDKLIPISMAQQLANATASYHELHTFPETDHVGGIYKEPATYTQIVHNFLDRIE